MLNKTEAEDEQDDQDPYGLRVGDQYVLFDPDYCIGKATVEHGFISPGSDVVGLVCGSGFKKVHPMEDDIVHGYGHVLHSIDKEENLYERVNTLGISRDDSINSTGSIGKWLPNE